MAGVASRLPAQSIAATRKVWVPFLSAVGGIQGDTQVKYDPESIRHLKVPASARGDRVNLKVGRVSLVEVGALVMEVFGFTVSTVNDRVAGTEVRFPLESTARTLKVWIPWLKPE